MGRYSDVTLKKRVFKGDQKKFWDWGHRLKLGTIPRNRVTISLLGEKGVLAMVWALVNAWPIKINATDLKSTGNEVVVETIVLAHEGPPIELS